MDPKRGLVNEIHKPIRKKFKRRSYIVKFKNDLFECDLVDLTAYSRENNGYKFILMIIDVFSKYAWAVALKSKAAIEVTNAMKSVLETDKRVPVNLHTDRGTEFYNSNFKKLMDKYKINHYSSFSSLKAAVVERLNRTIKGLMFKEFSYRGSYKWIDILQKIINTYNHSTHSKIKVAPADVDEVVEQQLIKNKVFAINDTPSKVKPKFKIGDFVRISKAKHVFEKSYTPNYTTEVFSIQSINKTTPVTYQLNDYQNNPISGAFYEPELLRTSEFKDVFLVEKILKRKRNGDLLIKWLGWDDSHSSWVKPFDLY